MKLGRMDGQRAQAAETVLRVSQGAALLYLGVQGAQLVAHALVGLVFR